MIYVVHIPNDEKFNYMAYEGTLHRSTHYGAYNESGHNYWVNDIRLLANPPCLVPHEDSFNFNGGITYGPFPTWESLARYEDYPEAFI